MAIRRYAPTAAFAHDGRAIAYIVNTSGQYNLWRQDLPDGCPQQLTLFTDRSVRDLAWSPDGRTIVFNADFQGNEMHQLFRIPATGGAPEQLTDVPDAWHFITPDSWSRNGRFIAYFANDRARQDMDIIVRDMRSGEVRRLLAGDAYYAFAGWSPDGRRMLVVKALSNSNSDIFLLDVKTGAARNLTEHTGEILQAPAGWAADGSGFYMVSDEGREFRGLAFYDLAGGSKRWVESPRHDVELAGISHDGRVLVWSTNVDGYSRLAARNLKTGRPIALPRLPRGVAGWLGLSPDGSRLGVLLARPTQAIEAFVVDLARRRARQITQSMLGGLPPRDLVEPRLVKFTSFDGREIPAFLFRPRHTAGRVPVVLSIHGGPEAQERPGYLYSGLYQYLLSRGIAVLAPNIRGSTGYGKSYQMLIHRDWGGAELRDIEAAAQYARGLDWVDPGRLAVFGGSFGGFATLSAVSRLPDYWAAAVDIVGPSNLVTFVKSVPPSWLRFMDEMVGNAERDYEMLMERSPVRYVDQVRAPLFIIQGANDPRVVQAESDQIVEQLRARGVPVRYDVYADEGHGFTRRENELKAWRDTAAFLVEHLLEEPLGE
jgi:dipeptidyl aminopeptidase/acylaminoacyl peptidase